MATYQRGVITTGTLSAAGLFQSRNHNLALETVTAEDEHGNVAAVQTFNNALIASANTLSTSAASIPAAGSPSSPPLFAAGGSPPLNRVVSINERGTESALIGGRTFAVFGRKTQIYNAKQTAGILGGGINIAINGAGMTRRQIMRAIDRQLGPALEEFAAGAAT